MKKILVIDDEINIHNSIRMVLKDQYRITCASSGKEALELIAGQPFDLALMDIIMPDQNGMDLLARVRHDYPGLPVIMVTAIKTVRTAVDAIKLGAVDYLTKPFDIKELSNCIQVAIKNQDAKTASGVGKYDSSSSPIIYKSAAMTRVLDAVKMVAAEECVVCIFGESGTGKELIARELHRLSKRNKHPFIAVNCAAIPDTLIENELFGHERGAYTNAQRSAPGKIDLANQGTLFFDEIGDLSLEGQAKLLRVIQDKTFMRVGGLEQISTNARFLFATNKDLELEVSRGQFRQDLFYRINVIPLQLPTLRERPDDIRALLSYYMEQTAKAQQKKAKRFSDEALNFLVGYHWPGNVRELKNIVEYLVSLIPSELIDWTDLPLKIRANQKFTPSVQGNFSLHESEALLQKEMIVNALRETDYVQTKAAELLGTTRRVLKYRMDKYGIEAKSDPEN